jgi:hypothetical protein
VSGKNIGELVSLGVSLIILAIGLAGFELGSESDSSPTGKDQVEVTSWNWKKSVNGRILAVFGSVKNKSRVTFEDVVLELRVEDETKTVLVRHTIRVGKLNGEEERPFRKDILRTGKEAMGFLEVKSLR